MVLDIAGASIFCGVLFVWSDSLELRHDDLKGLSNDVCQNVESSSVWHANNESPATIFDCGIYRHFETGNETLATFETETLHRVELLAYELSKVVGPV